MLDKRGALRRILIIIVAIVAVVMLLALLYFSFFYTKKVDNQTDFNKELYNCDKAVFLNDEQSAVWQYDITGKANGACRVEVSLITAKEGVADIKTLEGQSMTCDLPMGSINSPESNLKLCHGLLKEGIQEILIEKMHAYVTTNLGVIGNATG